MAKTAGDLGISESCLRNWSAQDAIDTGTRSGVTSDERKELAELPRHNRQAPPARCTSSYHALSGTMDGARPTGGER